MAKALLTDGLLSVFPAADACPADLCVVGKLLTAPAFCLPVSAEEVSAAPVEKQGVVVQNVLHRDAVKGGIHILFYNGIWCGILDATTGRPTRERKMITKHIVVEPFDEHWRLDFLKIQNELTDALGQLAIRIEHVGSTSVQGCLQNRLLI